MSLRVGLCSKPKSFWDAGAAKASPNRANLVTGAKPEAVVIYPWPGRSVGNTTWKAEPVNLEKFSDELWVGVKG